MSTLHKTYVSALGSRSDPLGHFARPTCASARSVSIEMEFFIIYFHGLYSCISLKSNFRRSHQCTSHTAIVINMHVFFDFHLYYVLFRGIGCFWFRIRATGMLQRFVLIYFSRKELKAKKLGNKHILIEDNGKGADIQKNANTF